MLVRSLADGEDTPSPRLLGPLSPAGFPGREVRAEFACGARIRSAHTPSPGSAPLRAGLGGSADVGGRSQEQQGIFDETYVLCRQG